MYSPDQIQWQGLQFRIGALMRLTTDVWPPEFLAVTSAALPTMILQSEERTRSDVDATIRAFVRRIPVPPLSPLEQWHLRHRCAFGSDVCEAGIAGNLPFPQFDDLESALESLLVLSWQTRGLGIWRERMEIVTKLRELPPDGSESQDPPPAR
jgi:hypothetical protein